MEEGKVYIHLYTYDLDWCEANYNYICATSVSVFLAKKYVSVVPSK